MRTDIEYLKDILDASRYIDDWTVGLSEEIFDHAEQVKASVLFKLMIIGEAATKISDELKMQQPGIDWKAISGFRNILVHAYFHLSAPLVWEAVTVHVPKLRDDVRTIINDQTGSGASDGDN